VAPDHDGQTPSEVGVGQQDGIKRRQSAALRTVSNARPPIHEEADASASWFTTPQTTGGRPSGGDGEDENRQRLHNMISKY